MKGYSAAAHLARANISKSATFVAYRLNYNDRLSYYLYSHKHSQLVIVHIVHFIILVIVKRIQVLLDKIHRDRY